MRKPSVFAPVLLLAACASLPKATSIQVPGAPEGIHLPQAGERCDISDITTLRQGSRVAIQGTVPVDASLACISQAHQALAVEAYMEAMMVICGLDPETGAIRGDIQKAIKEGILEMNTSGPDAGGEIAVAVIPAEDAREKICP